MPDGLDRTSAEPDTTVVRTFHVRRDDNLDELVDDIVTLLEVDGMVLDLSRYDRRSDVIELRKVTETRRR